MKRNVVGVFLAVLLVAGVATSQEVTRGAVLVRVEDPTGAVIPGATVTLVASVQPALQAETGAKGEVLFSNLIPANDYNISVTYQGFKTSQAKEISVGLGERRSVVIVLEPGDVVQTVEVVGAAAGIDFAETTTGGNIEDTIYSTIPLQRGLTSAFFLAPGVSDGGGTCGGGQEEELGIQALGCANPSVGGASGFENLYLIDGVNVTHGGFGGFGTVSRLFGSLGTGTTTSFIKEVEVKTGGYEAQYGQATGGIINVITKTGGNALHGAVFGYYSPNKLEAERRQPNRFRVENFQPFELHGVMQVDFGAEVGGYIWKDRLFFFASINPTVTRFERKAPQVIDKFAYGPGDCNVATNPDASGDLFSSQSLAGCFNLGAHDVRERTINYAFKLTGQINPDHRVEASLFGDPTIRKFGPIRDMRGVPDRFDFTSRPDFSRLDFSNLNFALRYNGVLTPTWLLSSYFSNNHNRFEEQELFNSYSVDDRTVSGVQTIFGGAGFFENTISDDKAWTIDNTNIISAGWWGEHELSEGFYFSTNSFDALRRRTGPDFPVVADPLLVDPADVGLTTFGATFRLFSCQTETGTADCNGRAPAPFQGATDTFFARQTRGEFSDPVKATTSRYTAAYVQDNWRMNQYLTLKLGLRWEQEELVGNRGVSYVYTGSWGPRVGVILDPFANRKTKVQFSFARFFQKLPNDLTVRVLSGGESYLNLHYWVEPDKVIRPDQAHYIGLISCPTATGSVNGYICDPAGGSLTASPTLSGTEGIAPIPGTKQTFQDEFTIGAQHEFAGGVVVGARYIDRRLKRVTEDGNGVSIEQANVGLFNIPFILMNPSASADFFTNPFIISIGSGPCFSGTEDAPGTGLCFGAASGDAVPDGIADGLPDPVREYKAVEITLERRMRDNWQFYANWRIAKLEGNFEGAFRNDNGQTDPGITSLFDFIDTPGILNTYRPGPLPNDRRHVVNAYGSYMFSEGWANGLNIGFGMRVSSGKPVTELLAHPLFENAGEIACASANLGVLDAGGSAIYQTQCESDGRGAFGRTVTTGTVDFRADYPVRIGERYVVRGSIDFFNVFNARRNQARNEFKESSFGLISPDFNTPIRFQRPVNVRFAVRFEF